jgi:uncharacterized protein (DUF433 family)
MAITTKTEHPYIVKQEGVCGGRAIIKGTRIPVWVIAGWVKQGHSPQEIQGMYSWLTLAQIHDALSYYYDHQQEIDEDFQANNPSDEELAKLQAQWQRLSST